jgi:putative membrane protein
MNWKYILLRWGITAAAVLLATYIVPGITIQGNGIVTALAVALVLGLVNAVVRPILVLLSCGCIVATLGLFMLVINAVTLYIASGVSQFLGINFEVAGFLPALIGSIFISIVSWLLSLFLIGENERGR